MSAYLDVRSDLFRRVFADALSYPAYLATGNARERAAWTRAEAAGPGAAGRCRHAARSGRPHRERALPQRDLVRGLRAVGPDRGAAGPGGRSVR